MVIPFKIIPQDFQWILGLLTPLPKMLFIKLYLKICSKAYGKITSSVKVAVVHHLQLLHALFLVLTMGFTATRTTSYTILGVKFFMSLFKAVDIIYMLKYSKKGYSVKEGRYKYQDQVVKIVKNDFGIQLGQQEFKPHMDRRIFCT